MSNIKELILNEVGTLKTSMKKMPEPHAFYHNSLREFLNCKEVRHIPADKRDEIFGWTPTAMFPAYEEFYRSLTDTDTPEQDYTALRDAHGISELFADSKRYIVTADYLRHARTNPGGFLINVYGHDASLISERFWQFTDCEKARDEFQNGNIPDFEFAKPVINGYSILGKSTYMDEVYIEVCENRMAVLSVDLPYKYYSTQNLKGNIFTWDLNTKRYQVGGKDVYEINTMIESIAQHGLEPLVFRINEGCLTPVDNDTAIKLFLATYMGLPSIPAILFMSEEDSVKNEGYEELHDVIHSNFWHNREAIDLINSITAPYMFFEMAVDVNTTPYLRVGDLVMHKSQYPSFINIANLDVDVLDRYLDTKAEKREIHLPMNDAEKAAKIEADLKALSEENMAKQKAENDAILQRILAGEFTD